MKNRISIVAFLLLLSSLAFSQSSYFDLSPSALQQQLDAAVKAEDFDKAQILKKETEVRKKEELRSSELEAQIKVKVKAEDFDAAASLQAELKSWNEKKIKITNLRQQITDAMAQNDVATAKRLRSELYGLLFSPAFEGRVDYEVSYENVPAEKKNDYHNHQLTHYFKDNKRRTEQYYNFPDAAKTVVRIYNFDKEEYLTLITVNYFDGRPQVKRAWLKPLKAESAVEESFTFLEDRKTFGGYDCRKVNYIFKSASNSINIIGYVLGDYSVTGFFGQKIPFLFLDYPPSVGQEKIITTNKFKAVKQGTVADNLFDTTIPEGFQKME